MWLWHPLQLKCGEGSIWLWMHGEAQEAWRPETNHFSQSLSPLLRLTAVVQLGVTHNYANISFGIPSGFTEIASFWTKHALWHQWMLSNQTIKTIKYNGSFGQWLATNPNPSSPMDVSKTIDHWPSRRDYALGYLAPWSQGPHFEVSWSCQTWALENWHFCE